MKRQAKIIKDLSTAQNLIDRKKIDIIKLKKEIAELEINKIGCIHRPKYCRKTGGMICRKCNKLIELDIN